MSMDIFSILLSVHIACGVAAMILGLLSFASRKTKGKHTNLGDYYHWAYLLMSLSAVFMALLDWNRIWWFLPIAVFSYLFALKGYMAAKRKRKDWIFGHVVGQCGSYIAMVTAVFVVALGTTIWWVWVLPSVIGTLLIIWLNREIASGRRPKYE